MSDFDDELLELVEAGSPEKKRKRSKTKNSSSKRRKPEYGHFYTGFVKSI